MCGYNPSRRARGGALAALRPITGDHFQEVFEFYTPNQPDSTSATWGRFNVTLLGAYSSDLYLIIHSTGDLTLKVVECGHFRRITFPKASNGSDFLPFELDEPLSLQVGGDGIIGRRVSLCSAEADVLAEGIIGFNFLKPTL